MGVLFVVSIVVDVVLVVSLFRVVVKGGESTRVNTTNNA